MAWLFGAVLQEEGNYLVRGGMRQVPLALASTLRARGGEIRTGAGVERILVEGGRATGVRLDSGETIRAGRLVAASVDPLPSWSSACLAATWSAPRLRARWRATSGEMR